LSRGTDLHTLCNEIDLEPKVIHQHLTNLRLLGLVQLVNVADTTKLTELSVHEKISRKSNDFFRAARVASEIKRMTAKLPPLTMQQESQA
jgi:hypothetical protein